MTARAAAWATLRGLVEWLRLQARGRATGTLRPSHRPRELGETLGLAMQGFSEATGTPGDALMGDEWKTPSPYLMAEWLLLRSGLVVPTVVVWRALEHEAGERPERFPITGDPLGVVDVPWWAAELIHRRLGAPGPLLQTFALGGIDAGEASAVFPPWRHADNLLERLLDLEARLSED